MGKALASIAVRQQMSQLLEVRLLPDLIYYMFLGVFIFLNVCFLCFASCCSCFRFCCLWFGVAII